MILVATTMTTKVAKLLCRKMDRPSPVVGARRPMSQASSY
jgi:hypothetical protein